MNYRLVNSQWKELLNSILGEKTVSREMEAFPRLGLGLCPGRGEVFHVWSSRWVGAADQENNLFPTKSLALTTVTRTRGPDNYRTKINKELTVLLSNFGGNLTTLELSKVRLGLHDLATILPPLTSLKLLILTGVISKTKLIATPQPIPLLTPITQPNLKTMVLKHRSYCFKDACERLLLHVWLIGSFSHQLEELDLDLDTNFQLLQAGVGPHLTLKVAGGGTVSIASFPDPAFCKLKKLIDHGIRSGIVLKGMTPVPQELKLDAPWDIGFKDLIGFLDKCATTLETVSLKCSWFSLMKGYGPELKKKAEELGGKLEVSTAQLLNVKTLAIPYPIKDVYAAIIKYTLLPKFPNLRTLNFLKYSFNGTNVRQWNAKKFVKGEHYWNDCGKLKFISVSSGEEAVGDVYSRRRRWRRSDADRN